MNAAAAVADILKREGVEYLFCFPVNALIDEDRTRGPKKTAM
jgi:thiamine pyrophosphate-dependent acetolactate synthase large subunit-like protein